MVQWWFLRRPVCSLQSALCIVYCALCSECRLQSADREQHLPAGMALKRQTSAPDTVCGWQMGTTWHRTVKAQIHSDGNHLDSFGLVCPKLFHCRRKETIILCVSVASFVFVSRNDAVFSSEMLISHQVHRRRKSISLERSALFWSPGWLGNVHLQHSKSTQRSPTRLCAI